MSKSSKLYQLLKSLDPDQMKPDQVGAALKENFKGSELPRELTGNPHLLGVAHCISVKVAKFCTEEEFCQFLDSGEVPPLKLSPEELGLLKGGGVVGDAWDAYTGWALRQEHMPFDLAFYNPVTDRKRQREYAREARESTRDSRVREHNRQIREDHPITSGPVDYSGKGDAGRG